MKDVSAIIAGKIYYGQFGAPNAPLHPIGGRAVVDPWRDIFSRVTIAPHCDERGLRFGVGIQMFSELASKRGALFDENLAQFRERVSPSKDDVCIARENDIGAVRGSRVRLNYIQQSQATAHAARMV